MCPTIFSQHSPDCRDRLDAHDQVTLAGSGYSGLVGQQRLNGYNVDWPRGELNNYTRMMNWETGVSPTTPSRQNPADRLLA